MAVSGRRKARGKNARNAQHLRVRRGRAFKAQAAHVATALMVPATRLQPAASTYRCYTDEVKTAAISAVFAEGINKHGVKRTVANRFNLPENTLKSWLTGMKDAESAIAHACSARRGRSTMLPKKVEDAIAGVVWKAWEQNRSLNKLQVLAIASDTARHHGIVWQARWDRAVRSALYRCLQVP